MSAAEWSVRSLRSGGVRLGAGALFYSGVTDWIGNRVIARHAASAEETGGASFAVLLYHRVSPERDPFTSAVDLGTFEAQMRYLAKRFRVYPLGEIVDRIRQGREIEPKTVAVTFDDGYLDNYLYAGPVLARHGIPATLFVAAGFIGNGRTMWNDRLAWALKHTARKRLEFASRGRMLTFDLETMQDRVRCLEKVAAELKALPEEPKEVVLTEILERLSAVEPADDRLMLDWAELREMAGSGWEIGSHTVGHVILTQADDARTTAELAGSKTMLEGQLQREVRLFAYPNGNFNTPTRRLVAACGYHAAVTTVGCLNGPASDLYALGRISPWERSLPQFATRLNFAFWRAGAYSAAASQKGGIP